VSLGGTGGDQARSGRPFDPARLGDAFVEWADRFDVSPQDLDTLYDRLHRTGANS
jgi:hypothetical protein